MDKWKEEVKMKPSKIFFVIFSLLLISSTMYAPSLVTFNTETKTKTWSDQSYLYKIYTASGYSFLRANPGFSGTFKTKVTINSKVLSTGSGGGMDGATICPGTATVESSLDARWAAPYFSVHDTLWELDKGGNPCIPGTSYASGTYHPINWNTANYNAMKVKNTCYNNDFTCWGKEGTFYDKKINYRGYSNKDHYNRQGKAAMTCSGTRTLTTTTSTYTGSGTSWKNTVNLNVNGFTYSIGDGFQVNGCALTVRHPVCAGTQLEGVFSRTSAQSGSNAPEYKKNLGSNTFSIKVKNAQNSIQYVSHSPAGTLKLTPGKAMLLKVTVKNNGNVGTTVYGAKDSESAACTGFFCSVTKAYATKYTSSMCTLLGGIGCPTNSGFDTNIPAGATRDLYIVVTPSNNLAAGTYKWNNWLILSFKTTEPTCNDQNRGIKLSFNVNVKDDKGKPDTCTIDPTNVIVEKNTNTQFNLTCYNSKKTKINCPSSTSWVLSKLSGTIVSSDNTKANVLITNIPGYTGQLTASVSSTVSCSSNIAVKHPQEPPTNGSGNDGCYIEPPKKDMKVNVPYLFNLTCYDAITFNPTPCPSASWTLKGVSGAVTSSSNTQAVAYVNSAVGSKGKLNATVNATVSCVSDVTVTSGGPTGTNATRCDVLPASKNVGRYEVNTFQVQCYDLGNNTVTCPTGLWTLNQLTGGFINWSNSDAKVYVESAIGSKGQLGYQYSNQFRCVSDLTVVSPSYLLTVHPPTWTIYEKQKQKLTTNCTFLGTPITCGTMQWLIMPNGLNGQLSGTSSTGATFNSVKKSTGRIRAYDTINNMVGFTVGSVLENTTSNNGTNTTKNDTNKTNPGPDPKPGDTSHCRIRPNPLNTRPGLNVPFYIGCGKPTFDKPCPTGTKFYVSDAKVMKIDPKYMTASKGGVLGSKLIVNAPVGATSSYSISAIVNPTTGEGCSAKVNIAPAHCWEYA